MRPSRFKGHAACLRNRRVGKVNRKHRKPFVGAERFHTNFRKTVAREKTKCPRIITSLMVHSFFQQTDVLPEDDFGS